LQRVPHIRVFPLNDLKPREGSYVLYWMTAFRRSQSNFSLQRAIEWAERLQRPLLILEAVRLHYRWSSLRFHQFLIDGMIDNFKAFAKSNAMYYAYVEPRAGDGSGLVETLCKDACLLVSDDFPCFFYPQLYQRISRR
jgi:deoxyribodipyrimidine photo-lyase